MDTNKKRRTRLLSFIGKHETVSIAELSKWLNVSTPTLRRDLNWLAELGLVERIHGGARRPLLCSKQITLLSQECDPDADLYTRRKRAIARFAASMCVDGDTIIASGGTTTLLMTEFLQNRQMNILTNSFLMARQLLATSTNDVVLTGGTIYRAEEIIATPFENDVAHDYYADKMFMSAHAVSEHGVMEIDPLLVRAKQRLMNRAEKVIVLADSSKFERTGDLRLCELGSIHCVITDDSVPPNGIRFLENAGVKVFTVKAV